MSATARNLLAPALLLGTAMGVAPSTSTAMDAHRGIWVDISSIGAWTLTVVNLTEEPLELVSKSITTTTGQRPPFNGETLDDAPAFPLAPFQNVTWKSNTASPAYPNPRWNGTLVVAPQGDTDGKWSTTLHFEEDDFIWCGAEGDCGRRYGTWAYLTADLQGNPDWQDPSPTNISCSYPDDYYTTYNVMTLSGTDYVAVFYAPYINISGAPAVDAVLVIRQRWPGEEISAPCLRYQDNNGTWSDTAP